MAYRVLLTCPPMIGMLSEFADDLSRAGFEVTVPDFVQEMSEEELCKIIGDFDGWIIGDDPATRRVLEAGVTGRLKACMRWGVGTNNVDFEAFKQLGVPIENTPAVFGREVADLACHYVIGLARDTFEIDRCVKQGVWHKPIGKSLWSANALVVGFGDIGSCVAKRLKAHEVTVSFCDPNVDVSQFDKDFKRENWPDALSDKDFVIFTTPLNASTFHMFDHPVLHLLKKVVKIVNVSRGPVINEAALLSGLEQGVIAGAALDVFENEPITDAVLEKFGRFSDKLIFGSHNGSNTFEAVGLVSRRCIDRLFEMLQGKSK